jgi:hypothetical protein
MNYQRRISMRSSEKGRPDLFDKQVSGKGEFPRARSRSRSGSKKMVRGRFLSVANDLQTLLDFTRVTKALCKPRQKTT